MLACRGLGRRETATIPVATAGLGAWAASGDLPLRHGYRIRADRCQPLTAERSAGVAAAGRAAALSPERAAWAAATRESPGPLEALAFRLVAERVASVAPERSAGVPAAGRWLALYADRHAAVDTDRTE